MSDASTYDNTGAQYNTTRILSPSFTLDEDAYSAYSPLFISTTFAMSYGLSFAAIASLIVYTWLNSRKHIMRQWKASTQEKPDVHMKMMQRYPEAPSSWYMGLFAVVSLFAFFLQSKLGVLTFCVSDALLGVLHGSGVPDEHDVVGLFARSLHLV